MHRINTIQNMGVQIVLCLFIVCLFKMLSNMTITKVIQFLNLYVKNDNK